MSRNERREGRTCAVAEAVSLLRGVGAGGRENGGPFSNEVLLILQLIECLLYFAPNLSL